MVRSIQEGDLRHPPQQPIPAQLQADSNNPPQKSLHYTLHKNHPLTIPNRKKKRAARAEMIKITQDAGTIEREASSLSEGCPAECSVGRYGRQVAPYACFFVSWW
ncbi:hypothetical protein JTE90_014099 [Oedothorax gibbosus]|uniref:Uncharacterized protein n=1 Tax=Oedothorax gibbosus TaxID=931172 RepID=A0AAV6V693_9ARAC|nr:hypothetical protein JTE90_014099 [Oedothorax gibbosus]